jgi:predicted phosphoribosyltransferase
MKPQRFRNRTDAGRQLAEKLVAYADRPDVLVLALPRGGVPVGFEVGRGLGVPLDVFLVRKLGVPGYEELAMGAVATGGVRVLNDEIVRGLGISEHEIDAVVARELQELAHRERLATMRATVQALRQQHPARIVIVVPTASPDTCEALKAEADDVICAMTPEPFYAVGHWYEDFTQTTDDEVQELLARRG